MLSWYNSDYLNLIPCHNFLNPNFCSTNNYFCPEYMKKTMPLVSVLLPIQNAEKTVATAIQSLLSQTYQRIEIIAIDDNSRDSSYKLVRRLARQDKRIKLFRNVKRYGMAITLNRSIKKAKGDLIAFMNPHDLSSKNRLKKQVEFLLSNPKVAAVGSQYQIVTKKNRKKAKSSLPTDHENIFKTLLSGISIQFETVMIHKCLLPKNLLKFTSKEYPFLFTDLFLKIVQYGKIANLSEYLYSKRETALLSTFSRENTTKTIKMAKLWLKSVALYDYRPSLRSLFTGIRINPN